MKIALNHRHFRPHGGVERYLWTFARKLVERGHEVHLFCSRFVSPLPEGMVSHHVPLLPLGESAKAVSFALNSRRRLKREALDGILGFGKTIYGDIYRDGSGCMKHFGEYLKKYEAGMGGALAHSLSVKQAAFLRLERLRFGAGAFRHIVAISRWVKDQILSVYDVPEENISVVYPGVDTARFRLEERQTWRAEIRASYGIPDDETVGIAVANGFSRKGIEPLLGALSRLEADGWRFLVIGKDKQLGRYEMLSEELGLESKVQFCGWREDVEKHLAASDFFVLNSRFDAFGMSSMEAMASSLPCVISAKAGSSEIVKDGHNGCVVSDPDDVEELSAAISGLLSEPERRAAMSENALRAACEHAIDRNLDDYLSLLTRE